MLGLDDVLMPRIRVELVARLFCSADAFAPVLRAAAAALEAALFARGPRARLGRTVGTVFELIC